jgi:hypothetical protein
MYIGAKGCLSQEFLECERAHRTLYVEWTGPQTSDGDICERLQVLRAISPTIGEHLKIDSSNVRKHPEIQMFSTVTPEEARTFVNF